MLAASATPLAPAGAHASVHTGLGRIRHGKQFDALLRRAPVAKTPHFALHALEFDPVPPPLGAAPALFPVVPHWLGALVPKRWARRAVTRNLVRRQIYALAADLLAPLPPQAWVVRLRSPYARQAFPSAASDALRQSVRAELLQLLQGPRRA
ncbi:MAG: ribonuclease P protein component [Pseudomonadota bacterium]|jgi:ribonuclease P protein component